MIRGSNVALWEALNDCVLFYKLDDGLPRRLGFGASLKYPAPVLLGCLCLALMPIWILMFSRPRKDDHNHTRAVLRSLLAFIVPTCSLWPRRYIKFASVLRSRVDIPLDVIIKDTIDGVTALRNPIDDVEDLIGSGATLNGHVIHIQVGWRWWISCLEWWMLAKSKPGYMPALLHWLHDNTLAADPSPPGQRLSLSSFAFTSSTSGSLLYLDCLPYGTIPPLNAGCKVTMEFMAFSPSLRTLSTAYIISAVPFMCERSGRRPRPLVSVLEQLSASYGPNLVVDSVSNVSVEYENALCQAYKSFSAEQNIREMWVKNVGTKAWRLDMFLMALEAAIVRRGWVERWAVQVTAK